MTNKPVTKEELINKCMTILSPVYRPGCVIYLRVEKSLGKLNNIELDSLYVMLMTLK